MQPHPPSSANDTAAARVARWLDLMRTTDKLLLAGLRRKIGPDGDLTAAYRQWYADHMRSHSAIVERVARQRPDAPQEQGHAGR